MTPSFDWDTFIATSELSTQVVELDEDQRWSTWPETAHTLDRGPQPFPDWVVQHHGAIDTELGVLKTGKEADAFLIERALPEEDRTGRPGEVTLMVAKRFRSSEHVSFHRSQAYADGRRTRDSRVTRAIARGTAFGREAAATQWARTEFGALRELFCAGLAVPYPVQIVEGELCMEFIGVDGERPVAASRLHEMRPDAELAVQWAGELRRFVLDLADLGYAHGDLSPYNVLVDPRSETQRLVVIDVPQVVDLVANPHGREFLLRDCVNVCTWLRAHHAPEASTDPEEWYGRAVRRYL
ncbi:serine protein kinase RIO [Pseudactinotalea suaedae]|uniref:serine protein kinase RIO n=1 Tax=Pseudactinotalea suaedae TaxID=1524924 RepID=UPI0012E26047|nr:RIO1 family regulatory kinase/ATPase [Pseudactinotalea suaedae]